MMTATRIVCAAALIASVSTGCSRADEEPVRNTGASHAQKENAPAAPPPAQPNNADTPVKVTTVQFDVPSAFQQRPPTSSMRVAEFLVHVPDDMTDTEPGEIVFFYFGPQGAGGVEANITRWASQVLNADGAPTTPVRSEIEIGDLKATIIRLDGTYMSGSPVGEKTPKPDFALLGAIVQGGVEGDVFIRMTGPARVLDAYPGLFEQLVRSARIGE